MHASRAVNKCITGPRKNVHIYVLPRAVMSQKYGHDFTHVLLNCKPALDDDVWPIIGVFSCLVCLIFPSGGGAGDEIRSVIMA